MSRSQGPEAAPHPSSAVRSSADQATAPLVVRSGEQGVPDASQRSLLRIAASLRRAIDASVDLAGSPEALERLAERVEAATAALEQAATGKLIPLMGWYEGHPDPSGMLPYSPVMGRLNPVAPPLRLHIEGSTAVGIARLGSRFQGAHRIAHGGVVAALFDEILAFGTIVGGAPGPTGELKVRYHAPTPLDEELRFEGWVEAVRERTTLARGRCWAGDRLCAEASGIFVRIRPSEHTASWTADGVAGIDPAADSERET